MKYGTPRAEGAPDGVCSAPNCRFGGTNPVTLWLSVTLVAAFAFLPNYVRGGGGASSADRQVTESLVLGAAPGSAEYEVASMQEEAHSERAPLSGHWIAEVLLADSTRVELVIDLDRLGSRWVGEFDVAEFGVENYPVQVELLTRAVTLHLAGPDADFGGALSADGRQLSGVLTFGDERIRTELRRSGNPQFSEMFLQLEAAADDSTLIESLSGDGAQLRRTFNVDHDKVRLLMLLSPT